MEQELRFTEVNGSRVAYATVGDGPLLVFGAPFVSHVELEWQEPLARAFYEQLAASHRVVRYDRVGVGLSDRDVDVRPSPELEARTLAAVIEAQDAGPASVFATSCAGIGLATLAGERPDLVERAIFFGGYVKRHDIPEAARRSLVDFVRANWPLAGRMFAGLKQPAGDRDAVDRFARYLRSSADAETAARYLELDLYSDLTDLLPRVEIPALVVHRRGDRVVPLGRGRELAALLPNARFVALSGEAHIGWLDDTRELRRALAGFLGEPVPEADGDSPLSHRETEVLRLVAEGLSNREIASSLVLSEHTVHRHIANILRKLGQSTRAAAAAQAARAGMV
jgi:pimeloyl-ACP methyl ester carboxylesterase/DNA-binding CsgD family transcriptional regulator